MSAEQAQDLLCRFQHLLAAVTHWTSLYESYTSDDQIHYKVRQGEGDNNSLFCVQATLQGVNLRSLYELLSRVENRKLWDISFEAGHVVMVLPCDFPAACIEYIRLAGIFPVVKQRDMTVLSVNAQIASDQIISASTSIQTSLAPSKKGYQRFNLSIGGCVLCETPSGVELTQITDIGDLVKWTPAYVIRTCTQVLVPRFLSKVRKEAIVLADTIDTLSSTDWKPPMWSQARLNESLAPEQTETQTIVPEVADPAAVNDASESTTILELPESAAARDGSDMLSSATENADGLLGVGTLLGQEVKEADAGEDSNSHKRREDEAEYEPDEQDQNATVTRRSLSSSDSSISESPAMYPVLESGQEEQEAVESIPSSPLPIPRRRETSTEPSHPELAMRRLSYFGGLKDDLEFDEELASTLPEALDSSTGIQAAHRLSRALSQLQLARCNKEESEDEGASPNVNDPGLEESAVEDSEELLVNEIREAAQPFFGTSIEGLLYTPSTNLGTRQHSKRASSSWIGSLSSILHYLPGSRLYASK